MLRLLADEDFNGRIARGLFLRSGDLDLIRVQDIGLSGEQDPVVLDWAEVNQRILLTHDARTMPRHVRDRLARGAHVPGVFIVDDLAPLAACIEDILLVAECSTEEEWLDQIHYLPFK